MLEQLATNIYVIGMPEKINCIHFYDWKGIGWWFPTHLSFFPALMDSTDFESKWHLTQ